MKYLYLPIPFHSMKIPSTRHTPLVDIDESKAIVFICGVCIPENAYSFFRPLEEYLLGLNPESKQAVTIIFRLEYMNTLSSKAFLDYMRTVKDTKGLPLIVRWEYYSDDEEMRDHGETFSEIVDIPFEYGAIDPNDRMR
jgi:SiaC family regulatory phosphoprotein